MNFIVFIVIIIGVFVLPFLQIYLSLNENKKLGLIIPGMTIALGVMVPFIINLAEPGVSGILIIYVILACGATTIHMIIYFICRIIVNKRGTPIGGGSSEKDTEITKMKIKDLG